MKIPTIYGKKGKHELSFTHIIACAEQSAGNAEVGSMWLDTKSFPVDTPVSELLEWAEDKGVTGKLFITVDESSVSYREEDDIPF